VIGTAAADVIWGGAGTDTLRGAGGDDTFRIAGADSAYDLFDGGDGYDTVLGGDGDDTVRVHSFSAEDSVEAIDGGAGLNILAGTGANDTLDLSATVLVNIDHIDAGAGNDTVIGTALNDVIWGGAGTDTLHGGEGDDTLEGNAGDDTLFGDGGDDVYRFGYGDGQDTIVEEAGNGNPGDRLELGEGIEPIDVMLSRHGDDLLLTLAGSADAVRVQDWYAGSAYELEKISAANGSTLLSAQVDQLVQAMAGFTVEQGAGTWEQAVAQDPEDALALVTAHWQA